MGNSANATAKDRIELFMLGRTFNKAKQVGVVACSMALGWAFMGANGLHILPDTIATVLVGVILVEFFRS